MISSDWARFFLKNCKSTIFPLNWLYAASHYSFFNQRLLFYGGLEKEWAIIGRQSVGGDFLANILNYSIFETILNVPWITGNAPFSPVQQENPQVLLDRTFIEKYCVASCDQLEFIASNEQPATELGRLEIRLITV